MNCLHPASLILIWLAFAFCVPWLRPAELSAIVFLFSLPLLLRHSAQYLKLLRRSRWLLISLILVYAFVTPGVAAIPVLGAYSPSREGLLSGGLQALRLLALLATLALLLATTSRDRILAGLYFLLRPFILIGVDVDRVAARIWLTLHYAEKTGHAGSRRSGEWRERLRAALHGSGHEMTSIELEIGSLSWSDCAALFCFALVFGLLLARGAT
ncbi:MAG: CbiQ family ECF transporter T component [Sulfuricella sp.]|nr:CbiQ family ECF transporter T component [Sulfuricella sp.]